VKGEEVQHSMKIKSTEELELKDAGQAVCGDFLSGGKMVKIEMGGMELLEVKIEEVRIGGAGIEVWSEELRIEERRIEEVEVEENIFECEEVDRDKGADHICPPVELRSGDNDEEAAAEDVGESAQNMNNGDLIAQTEKSWSSKRVDVAKVSTSPGERLKPKKRRLLPLASSMPPLQLEVGEVAPDVAAEVTFREVHKESFVTGTWVGYPTENAGHRGNLRGFRKNANYYVKEEDEKLLKYILEKGMERYVKSKNIWLAMERLKVVENRSWQSMKERFLKSIMKKLDMFAWVGKEEKERLRMGAAGGRKRKIQPSARSSTSNVVVI